MLFWFFSVQTNYYPVNNISQHLIGSWCSITDAAQYVVEEKLGFTFMCIFEQCYTDCGWGAFTYTNSFDILKTTGELGHNLNLIGTLVILRVSWALRTTVIVKAQYVTIQQRHSNFLEEAVVGYHHKLSKSVLRSGRFVI